MSIGIMEMGSAMKFLTMKHVSVFITYCLESKELFVLGDARKKFQLKKEKKVVSYIVKNVTVPIFA